MKNKKKIDTTPLVDKLIKNKKEWFDNKFKLTPLDILYNLLAKYYKSLDKDDVKTFKSFNEELVAQLSLLSTDGKNEAMLGNNFDVFYQLFIVSVNANIKMEKLLIENGIEFDIDDDLNNGPDDDSDDDSDDGPNKEE